MRDAVIREEIKGFDWNEGNKVKNWLKHKVFWRECEEVFFDTPQFAPDPKHSAVEKRWVAYGQTSQRRFLTVVFTVRRLLIRVISARDQSKTERKLYTQFTKHDEKTKP